MTLTEKRRIARQARRHGYFHPIGSTSIYVFCPLCSDRVEGMWDTGTRAERSLTAELDRVMIEHLDYCRAERREHV